MPTDFYRLSRALDVLAGTVLFPNSLTISSGGTLTLGAITFSGTVSGGGQQLNNIVIGTSTPLAGTFTAIVGTGFTITSEIIQTADALAFQKAYTISTTAGNLTLNPASEIVASKTLRFATAALVKVTGTASRPWASELVHVKGNVADNTATGFITVTVESSAHYASIWVEYQVVSENFDRMNTGRLLVLVARTTGSATIATIDEVDAQQTINARGAETVTLTFALSAMTGGVNAAQTFTINYTADSSANTQSLIAVRARLIQTRYNQADNPGVNSITMAGA